MSMVIIILTAANPINSLNTLSINAMNIKLTEITTWPFKIITLHPSLSTTWVIMSVEMTWKTDSEIMRIWVK